MDSLFICPVCGKNLTSDGKTYKCGKNHSFDVSSKGYVNLLLSNKMKSAMPGDNKLMVGARRDFLSKGYYGILRDALCGAAEKYFDGKTLLDAGCGEGYYTSEVCSAIKNKLPEARVCGIDISKTACAYAAKACKDTEIAVGSIFGMPIADNSIDMAVTLFAPFCLGEFSRIIPKGKHLIMVIPAPRHLWEMKAAVYDSPYPNEPHEYSLDGFSLAEKINISGKIELSDNKDIVNLFSMTPYYYKTGIEGHERVKALEYLVTEIEFEILVYSKK